MIVLAGGRRTPLTVTAVVRYDGTGSDQGALLMPLPQAQRVLGVCHQVQHVLVSNTGDATSGAGRSDIPAKVHAGAGLSEAGRLMLEQRVDALAVVDEFGLVVGILTGSDLISSLVQVPEQPTTPKNP